MDLVSWLCSLSDTAATWSEFADCGGDGHRRFPISFQLPSNHGRLIVIQAEKSDDQLQGEFPFIDLSICLEGFEHLRNTSSTTLWAANPLPLSSNNIFISLLIQVVNEILSHSPTKPLFDHTANPHSIGSNFETILTQQLCQYPLEQLSKFMEFILLSHLFWKCLYDIPAEVGLFYFQILSSNLRYLNEIQPLITTLSTSLGPEYELYLMRSFGYILAKLWILKEMNPSQLEAFPANISPSSLSFSYAMESHGLLLLRGYAPIQSMTRTCFNGEKLRPTTLYDAKESLLRYALGHQLLEALVQFEYTISHMERYIQVCIRLDNIRINVTRLGYNSTSCDANDEKIKEVYRIFEERHFPSRVRVFLGPSTGLISLGRSIDNNNDERELAVQEVLKGSWGDDQLKSPKVKAISKNKTRVRMKNWEWNQDAEGNVAVFEAILFGEMDGLEVARWQPSKGEQDGGEGSYMNKVSDSDNNNMRRRGAGTFKPLNKSGGVVFAGDKYGEQVKWRMGKEMAGKVLKWKVGGKIWLSYFPNEFKTHYFDARYIEWNQELELIVPEEE